MSKMSELYYDIEQMYIDGLGAKRIALLLDCDIQMVYAVLEDMGVATEVPDANEDYQKIAI